MKLMQQSIINFRFSRNFATTKSKKSTWKSVVGLEVHAQIASKSKLFSGAANKFGAPPNTCVSAYDAAEPGTLPVLNERCVIAGIQTALALGCKVNPVSMFDRKHYFYADLPAGFQITQQRAPLASNGKLSFYVLVPGVKPYQKTVRLHQLQLEEDSGKSFHDPEGKLTLIDLNRAGVPLMELVFEPDLSNGDEAAALIKELVLILKAIGTCSCRMFEGALRVDANISIHQPEHPFGVRTEVKNIGTVSDVADAVDYEIKRQISLVERGGVVENQTRSWDSIAKKTVFMRGKDQHDYRFMPEPNLPPLRLNMGDDQSSQLINVEALRRSLPELPERTRNNLVEQHGLRLERAIILVNETTLLRYFTDIVKAQPTIPSKTVADFLINVFLRLRKTYKIDMDDCRISVANLAELVTMLHDKEINNKLAWLILQEFWEHPDQTPMNIASTKNLKQINDPAVIEKICRDVLDRNAKAVQEYKQKGKEKIYNFFKNQVMKATEDRANYLITDETLKELLKK